MSDQTTNILGIIGGGLIYAFGIWNITCWLANAITKYKKKKIDVLIVSFIISVVITLVIGWLWYYPALLFHLPIVIVLFLYDLVKIKNKQRVKIDA